MTGTDLTAEEREAVERAKEWDCSAKSVREIQVHRHATGLSSAVIGYACGHLAGRAAERVALVKGDALAGAALEIDERQMALDHAAVPPVESRAPTSVGRIACRMCCATVATLDEVPPTLACPRCGGRSLEVTA